ncbi:transcription termination factor Rho [Mycolicibacterium flavescens]|uniref:Transcription termination factor Rho n=1 Tax=Mycolicibacterium flavescens TaxID=1776 RepID=A0A1E3RG98_MYCFV|nr:transcription termination factor Rho [Mycolicibacterium flavescens]MCV7280498.1 transcription termination factor Rho [Mycolicibacterium flavescens]ODQ88884.1 transcription termination factor Rho [Mycolicibacterium flavescens]
MTDTDLFTAGGSSDNGALSDTVSPDTTSAAAGGAAETPTAETAPTADVASGDRAASLSTMVLPELRALAKEIGVEGASGMRKSELVAAIRERRGDANGRGKQPRAAAAEPAAEAPAAEAPAAEKPAAENADAEASPPRRQRRGASRTAGAPVGQDASAPSDGAGEGADTQAANDSDAKGNQAKGDDAKDAGDKAEGAKDQGDRSQGDRNQGDRSQGDRNQGDRSQRSAKSENKSDGDQQSSDQQGDQNRNNNNDDDGDGRGGRRGRRFRDRRRRERGGDGGGGETELRDDDVVQPVAGILDVLDNYAFVRTSGYLAGPNDVYVSMNMVRKNGLRRGDAVTGAVRVPKEGGDGGGQNPRQKFNPLVRLDTVNGKPVEEAKKRPDFNKLTPLYPNQRLRLETSPDKLTTRVIDLIMPIGKGQRALIVSPPKAGKTTIMQDIANAITTNNPECHLMVVLVDERPEEVTDMQRSVKGEVIASTFDRPPSDHTQAAELAIERAKRLVEQGKDVVVLLDSITRLGRAYNNASPASGRILSGGVDSTALYPPKRFLGAARNIEEGGSLTIVATAMVETGSTGDTVIFEEFKGTGNAELKLDRKIAERRVFPAVDVNPSGTRKDELLLSADEFAVVHKLRRVLSGLDPHQAIDLLMSQLRKTKNNYEFLVQVSKTAPGSADAD